MLKAYAKLDTSRHQLIPVIIF